MILLSAAERQFIRTHLTDDVRALLLRAQPGEFDLKKLAAQLAARQKARLKLPTWYASDEVVFPPALSVEQASSEQTAHYKASLVGGHQLIDLTGGMGVDTRAFAQRVAHVSYVEQRAELADLAAYNLPRLGAPNVTVRHADALAYLEPLTETADWLYLDPHRRDEQGGKVVRLEDCEPDVSRADVRSALLAKTTRILLKTSPLIDIDATIRQLSSQPAGGVEAVHVVAVGGEVKEVLFVLTNHPKPGESVEINAVNLLTDKTISFCYEQRDERRADVRFGDPERYVYEPNAAILKAGAFRLVGQRFGLIKLAPNSHLYTSQDLRLDFPGRLFAVNAVIKPDGNLLRTLVPTMQANLTVRNFPQSVADLRKKLDLREGGHAYLFATTLLNGDKRLLITHKVARAEP